MLSDGQRGLFVDDGEREETMMVRWNTLIAPLDAIVDEQYLPNYISPEEAAAECMTESQQASLRSVADNESLSLKPKDHHEDDNQKRSITTFQLAMITYFFTCGGPFGIEPSVQTAGPLYALIAIVAVPLFWSLPQALMAAELSLMMKRNGGNILWAKRAFGFFGGWINAYNNIIYFLISISILVVLVIDYLPSHIQDDLTFWQSTLIKFAFVFTLTVLNIWGISWISRISFLLLIAIMAPFAAQWIAGPVEKITHWEAVDERRPLNDIHFGVFLSTVLWSYGGFDAMGTFAGEVKGGKLTYFKGILFALPFDIATYFFPVFIGYVLYPYRAKWGPGSFPTIGGQVGDWMQYWVVAAAEMGTFGTYAVAMASLARSMWACGRGPQEAKLMPGFVSWGTKSKGGTVRPIAAIIIVGIISFCLSLGTFNVLVQATMTVRLVNLAFEYGALIVLRFTEPDTPRPFKLPGGKIMTIIITLPSVALGGIMAYGNDSMVWIIVGAIEGSILVLYILRTVALRLFHNHHRVHTGYTINYTTESVAG